MSMSRRTWTTPSSSSCATALRNCLKRCVSLTRTIAKCVGRERRESRELDGLVEIEGVADAHLVGVDEADHVAGEGLVDGDALLPEDLMGVLGGERLAGAAVREHHAPLEAARAHPQEREAVAVRGVHVGLDLEHEPAERRVERPGHAVDVEPRARRRHVVDDGVEQQPDAEVGQRGTEEDRRHLAREERLGIERRRDALDEVAALLARSPRRRPLRRRPAAASTSSSGAIVAPRAVRVKRMNSPLRRSMTPRKSPAMPTGHVMGEHTSPICCSISSMQLELLAAGAVPLVDEGDQRQPAGPAHLEQLERLRLDALGRVEHHDRAVGGGDARGRCPRRSHGGPGCRAG